MASISGANSRMTANIGSNRGLVIPIFAGVLGALFLSSVYLGIVTLAQGWQHAVELFWQDKFLVTPIIAGFGTQIGLYTFLKVGLHTTTRGAGAMAGAGGGTSTAAMVACCAHHVTDILPLVGLSAATTFLANSKVPFMPLGLAMNTHSVDLGFDLKSLSVLKTDTGAEIAPSAYQGGSGHHVTGKLSFPADKLVGAKTLMLIIKNVAGVTERTFTWNLQ